MDYKPEPIDTSGVKLTEDIMEHTELLAKNTHNVWARQKIADGWHYGPVQDEHKKEHPWLLPYEELPEHEKVYDRSTALETIKAVIVLGYKIEKR